VPIIGFALIAGGAFAVLQETEAVAGAALLMNRA
jgi:uncharacterized ion transporter superfamily protein YfcC